VVGYGDSVVAFFREDVYQLVGVVGDEVVRVFLRVKVEVYL
jgi:hypothetical protein